MPSEPNLTRISALTTFQPDTTARDWYSIVQEMEAAISVLNPEWTARTLADPGITIYELVAIALDSFHHSLDTLHLDGRFKESFSREAVISFAEMTGYTPSGASPASVDVTYSLSQAQDSAVAIPEDAELQTSSDPVLYFENDAELIISGPDFVDTTNATGTTTTIKVVDSLLYDVGDKIEIGQDLVLRTVTSKPDVSTVAFVNHPLTLAPGSGVKVRNYGASVTSIPLSVTGPATEGRTLTSSAGIGDGTKLKELILSLIPIIDNTLQIFVNEGGGDVLWTQATNNRLVNHNANENVYELSLSGQDVITVRFGDGINGRKLPNGATVSATARIGGGLRGNVGAGLVDQINEIISVSGSLSVTNRSAASGGLDRESLIKIKENVPNSLRLIAGNIVSITDYKTAAESVSGVVRAQAFFGGSNIVSVYIIPSGISGSLPSSSLLNSVEAALNDDDVRLITTIAQALPPNYVTIDMEGKIYLNDDSKRSTLITNITTAFTTFFSSSNRSFGRTGNNKTYIHLSDIYYIIENESGVDYSEITKFTRRPRVEQYSWSGDATVSEILVGFTTIEEEWMIVFTSATTFTVKGSVNVQSQSGYVNQMFSSNNSEISFMISSGSIPMQEGDRAVVKTSAYLSTTIKMYDSEFPLLGRAIGTSDEQTITIIGGLF